MTVQRDYKMVVIGGSAGSFPVVRKILASLPVDYPIPLVICMHRLKDIVNGLEESLGTANGLPVKEPEDKDPIRPGYGYLAPANYHLLIEASRKFALSIDEEVHFSRPSIDITFESAGVAYMDKMIGIILSGANVDGARGLHQAHRRGALAVVQDPEEAMVKTMPEKTIRLFEPDRILNTEEIITLLQRLR